MIANYHAPCSRYTHLHKQIYASVIGHFCVLAQLSLCFLCFCVSRGVNQLWRNVICNKYLWQAEKQAHRNFPTLPLPNQSELAYATFTTFWLIEDKDGLSNLPADWVACQKACRLLSVIIKLVSVELSANNLFAFVWTSIWNHQGLLDVMKGNKILSIITF